jgi:hypothetical protein
MKKVMKDVFKAFGIGFGYAAGVAAGIYVGTDFLGETISNFSKNFLRKTNHKETSQQ